MSMGGATYYDTQDNTTGTYRLDNVTEAYQTAERMYYTFFADEENSNYPKVFKNVELDGADLDIGKVLYLPR